MPKRIFIIGNLFCLVGFFGIWNLATDLYQLIMNVTQWNLDLSKILAVLLLPIGISLLLGQAWAQWWARLSIVVAFVFCLVSIVFAIASPEDTYFNGFNQSLTGISALPYVITPFLILTSVLVFMYRLLYSNKANTYFNRINR